jgi:hypothetical protein
MGTGSTNVKFCANPINEYISRRIGCQRFYDAPRMRDQEQTATWRIFGGPKASSSVWPPGSGCLDFETARSSLFYSPMVGDQRLSESDGSENQMISGMQVINFLTGKFRYITKGREKLG